MYAFAGPMKFCKPSGAAAVALSADGDGLICDLTTADTAADCRLDDAALEECRHTVG